MRPRGCFKRNQDCSRWQKMSLKVSIIFITSLIKNKHSQLISQNYPKICHSIVVDLAADTCLDDLASLLQLDSKNMNVEQLGIDLIKEQ